MIKTTFTRKENTDSGMALTLILIFGGLWFHSEYFYKAAFVVVLLTMIVPSSIYPFTITWLNFSDLFGRIMSKIILSILYFLILFPTAVIRKAMGKDTLLLKSFKKSTQSVFIERNHIFSKSDLHNPF